MGSHKKNRLHASLRLKILAMAIIPVIVIQAAVGIVAFFAYNIVTTEIVVRRDTELATLTAERVRNYLESPQHMAAASREFQSMPGQGIKTPDPAEAPTDTLPIAAPQKPDENDIIVLMDAKGIVLAVNNVDASIIGQDWSVRTDVQQTIQNQAYSYSDVTIDTALSDQPGIIGTIPLYDNLENFIGIALEFSPIMATDTGFHRSLEQILENNDRKTIYIIDGQGKVIYHPNADYIGKDFSSLEAVQSALEREAGATFTHDMDEIAAISSYAPIPNSTWSLILDDSWENITANTTGYQNILLALLLMGVAVPAVVVAWGMKHITKPIEALTQAANKVACGQYDQTIDVRTGDEIETLANQFNQMSAEVRDTYATLESKVRERTAALEAATEQARRSAEAAEAANRAKSVFLANMSHELRTPLNAILGYSQLLARDPLATRDQREALETIGRSGEHLLGLINDVLTMSKIEAGRTSLEENAFDLYLLLNGLGEMFQMRANDKGLKLLVDIASDTPQYIFADEGKLRQVFMNLLSNAIKFTQEGGITIRVEARAADEGVMLHCEVEDTGVGIAQSEIPTLFEPFVQTNSGKQSKEGTGLGLPISRQFINLLGGELDITSEVGRGSIFRFVIPVQLAQADAVESRAIQFRRRVTGVEAAPLAPDGQPFRLLIVEDQPANQNLMLRLLQPFGFDVRCVNNGREGVEAWDSWSPHLIWMDMRMPVMDGYEATRQIKARAAVENREVIIVALTASAFEEERAAILAAGCDDFLRKPFREGDLFDILSQYLDVKFTYAEADTLAMAPVEADDSSVLPALKTLLPTLGLDWAVSLNSAATQLDADQMLAIIEQLRPHAPELADQLGLWVRSFDYEKILDLAAQLINGENA